MTTQSNKSSTSTTKRTRQGRKKYTEPTSPQSPIESSSSSAVPSQSDEQNQNQHQQENSPSEWEEQNTPQKEETIEMNGNHVLNSSASTTSTTPSSPRNSVIRSKTVVQALHESNDGKDDFDDAVLEGEYIHLKMYAKSDGIRVRPRKLHLSKEVLILHPKDLSSVGALQETMTEFQIPSINIASINKEDLDMLNECDIHSSVKGIRIVPTNSEQSASKKSKSRKLKDHLEEVKNAVKYNQNEFEAAVAASLNTNTSSTKLEEDEHEDSSASSSSTSIPKQIIINIPTPNIKRIDGVSIEMEDKLEAERKKNKHYLQDLYLYKRKRIDSSSTPEHKKKKKKKADDVENLFNSEYVHYNAYNPPFEYDFALEYDITEQDEQFLEEWNNKRKQQNKSNISDIWFERLMSWLQRSLLSLYLQMDTCSFELQQHSLLQKIVEGAKLFQQKLDSSMEFDLQIEEVEALKQYWMKNNAIEMEQLEQYQQLLKSKQIVDQLAKFKQYLEMTRLYFDTLRKKERIKQNMAKTLWEEKVKEETATNTTVVEPTTETIVPTITTTTATTTDISNDDEETTESTTNSTEEERKKNKRGRKRKKL